MDGAYLKYRFAQWLSERLHPRRAYQVAEQLADLQWRRSPADRTAVAQNVEVVFGASVPGESPVVREVFRNFGRNVVEFFTVHRVPRPDLAVEGSEHLAAVRRRRLGTIILTGHVGNWEVGAVLIRRMGVPLSAIVLPHRTRRMDRLFNDQRRRCGVDVIPLSVAATQQCLQRLGEGASLGMLIDRDFTGTGEVMPVCAGHLRLPRGPALLSLRSGAAVLPSFLIREGVWKFRLCFEPPIWPDRRGGLEASIRALTGAYAGVLERYLRRFPEQWLVFQPLAMAPALSG